jgi:riboflavin transporter FmnP
MHKNTIRQITLAGLFIAIGLILPMAFHVLGPGTTFLPMHIPVLMAGFSLGLPMALLVGILTPILSSLLTGMPLIFPVLPFMILELGTYAILAHHFYIAH